MSAVIIPFPGAERLSSAVIASMIEMLIDRLDAEYAALEDLEPEEDCDPDDEGESDCWPEWDQRFG